LINEFCTVVETGSGASARPAWHWQGYALVITSTGDPESGKRGVEIILRRNPDTYHSGLSTGIDRNALHLRTAKGSSEDIEYHLIEFGNGQMGARVLIHVHMEI
jgi:hypothetical protein